MWPGRLLGASANIVQSAGKILMLRLNRTEGRSARTICYTPVHGCLPTRVALATRQVQFSLCPCGNAVSELLGKRDEDALRAANVAEPVPVLVLGDFADELSAMGAQAREDVIEVVDGEHDATYAQRV